MDSPPRPLLQAHPGPTPQTPSRRPRDSSPTRRALETPRTRKVPNSTRLQGVKQSLPANLSVESIKRRLQERLNLKFEPDDWQAHLIRRTLQGYDSILCAGTGYGKSLIFEGLAALGGRGKLIIVISPLKALQRDQVKQANEKGLSAIAINEDTSRTADLWAQARTSANILQMSPEMALSASFQKLWKDARFRERLLALIVDEAHCVDEWGHDDFRPQYRELGSLRNYTSFEIPILSCTATCRTSTFNLIWKTLRYGNRPFWGLDVGSDRPNLFYTTRPLAHPKSPILEVLNVLPKVMDDTTTLDDLPKTIIYIDSEAGCRSLVAAIRKCLPKHLRSAVQAFSADFSERGKAALWEKFEKGTVKILVATDAAGMGCNVPNVEHVITIHPWQ